MRTTGRIGMGALTTASLLGTALTATAHAAGGPGNGFDPEFRGTRILSNEFPAVDGLERSVLCPLGTRLTGGGVRLNPAPNLPNPAVVQVTAPTREGDGWVGAALVPAGTPVGVTMTVYALCTRAGGPPSFSRPVDRPVARPVGRPPLTSEDDFPRFPRR